MPISFVERGNRRAIVMIMPAKPSTDCECPCHLGDVIIHVVRCCDGYIPGASKQKRTLKQPSTEAPFWRMAILLSALVAVLAIVCFHFYSVVKSIDWP
jgi:hypothetical protein